MQTMIHLLELMLDKWGSARHQVFAQVTNRQCGQVSEIPGRVLTIRSAIEAGLSSPMIHSFHVMPRGVLDTSQVFPTIRYMPL